MSAVESLTAVEDIAHQLNKCYIDARITATPLLRSRNGMDLPVLQEIKGLIFELGVNAAYGWYTLLMREVESPDRALREATRLRADSERMLRVLRARVAREWREHRKGAGPYEPATSLRLRNRHSTYRMHRRYVPLALGGKR